MEVDDTGLHDISDHTYDPLDAAFEAQHDPLDAAFEAQHDPLDAAFEAQHDPLDAAFEAQHDPLDAAFEAQHTPDQLVRMLRASQKHCQHLEQSVPPPRSLPRNYWPQTQPL